MLAVSLTITECERVEHPNSREFVLNSKTVSPFQECTWTHFVLPLRSSLPLTILASLHEKGRQSHQLFFRCCYEIVHIRVPNYGLSRN